MRINDGERLSEETAANIQAEENLGVLGPPVSGRPKDTDGLHMIYGSKFRENQETAVRQLEIEERRAQPKTEEEKRQDLQGRIAANAQSDNPRGNYFVREPGL